MQCGHASTSLCIRASSTFTNAVAVTARSEPGGILGDTEVTLGAAPLENMDLGYMHFTLHEEAKGSTLWTNMDLNQPRYIAKLHVLEREQPSHT